FGTRAIVEVATDRLGRMRPDALRAALGATATTATGATGATGAPQRPTVVVAQAGEVNTGAFDPLGEICAIAHAHGAWVHVDGAFGLWAAVSGSPARRELVAGAELAESWATDGHKWLNVPYDCGIALVADRVAHRRAMSTSADYFVLDPAGQLDPVDWTPEFSRRARALAVYAALRSLGRAGLRDLVDRCCDLADHAATRLAALPGVTVLNATGDPAHPGPLVALNQVLIRVDDPHPDHSDLRPDCPHPRLVGQPDGLGHATQAGDDGGGDTDGEGGRAGAARGDRLTRQVTTAVTAGGEAYVTGTVWRGRAAMRLSVSNWATTRREIDRAIVAITAAIAVARREPLQPGTATAAAAAAASAAAA
ncbi:pyridoxal-dependent decarboxylase, partial [Frankia sp. AiPs1]|uniref:pyridoxal phosphate-dependent decarboxylase family protein n=1 Tax=Frankia sp. AiPs1 TaxID=573493 RepID=UPI0020435D58